LGITNRLPPVSDAFARQETFLAETLGTAMRGPRRNGLFALWLVLRCCGDLLPPNRVGERGHSRRVEGLERRLHGLSLPGPLRRALTSALQQLREGTPAAAGIALQQLVAPVDETLGATSGKTIARAAELARARVRNAANR
jgi:hypothetical protein